MNTAPYKLFLYYLVDIITGKCYYIDDGGHVQLTSITAPLRRSPQGWLDNQVSFGRNSHYYGINRTFTPPLKFIDDAARIIRNTFYPGRGIEVQLGLVIHKWSPETGNYELYYSGKLDLTENEDESTTGVNANVMEGGIAGLLKTYENTVFQIPCDGSIPENIKARLDGIEFRDTMFFQIVLFQNLNPSIFFQPIATAFIDHDGDNIGVIKGDQTYTPPDSGDWFQTSANYLFTSIRDITLTIKGSIIVESTDINAGPAQLRVKFLTSAMLPADETYEFINTVVTSKKIFNFSLTIDLPANQNLFLVFQNFIDNAIGFSFIKFYNSDFQFSFNSRYQATNAWCITAWDLFRLLVKNICELASTSDQSFNYGADSNLLQENLNFVVTSGDALRASGDPNYKRFYSISDVNQAVSFGPVIKTSLSDFFDSFNPILNASLGNQKLKGLVTFYQGVNDLDITNPSIVVIRNIPNVFIQVGMYFVWQNNSYKILSVTYNATFQRYTLSIDGMLSLGYYFAQSYTIAKMGSGIESVFFERKNYVFNKDEITVDLGEVAELKISVATDHIFSQIEIGFPPQTYDQKQGKFEYNTTAKWQTNIKSLPFKKLSLISKYRADSYGVERLRFPSNDKSTTANDSDNSVFVLNVDYNSFELDAFTAKFDSTVPDPDAGNNTNLHLTNNIAGQEVALPDINGSFFLQDNRPAIFLFNQASLNPGTSFDAVVTFAGTLAGNPGDTLTIKMWVNPGMVKEWVFTMPGDMTFSEAGYTLTRIWSFKDTIHFTAEVSGTGSATLTLFQLDVQTYFIAQQSGIVEIANGSGINFLALPNVVSEGVPDVPGTEVVSYGFQYFVFNEILINSNFDVLFDIEGYLSGNGEFVQFDLYLNGTYDEYQFTGTISGRQSFNGQIFFNRDFQLGDLLFIVARTSSNANVQVTNASLAITSTVIKAYNLLRKNYDQITGIVNPQTAFNIEGITPRRLFARHGNYIRSGLFNQIPGMITFQSIDKNQYLTTTLNGETIKENADIDISELDSPLFYPLIFDFKTKVPWNFSQLLAYAANGHVKFTFNGVTLYGFPNQVTQKPSLNESQEWKLLCSPLTNVNDLVDLEIDGLNYINLQPYTMFIPIINPLHFVGLKEIDPKYHSQTIDQDWLINRIQLWSQRNNYFSPWQSNDTIQLQIQTNGLSPVKVDIYTCKGVIIDTIIADEITTDAVNDPMILWQVSIPLNLYPVNQIYYFLVTAGTGLNISMAISEGISLKASWPKTILFEYKNKVNKQAAIFSEGFYPSFRVAGWIASYKPKSKKSVYEDEPADIELLAGIGYDSFKLYIGRADGVPDWVIRKLNRIMLLTDTFIDGHQYTRDEDSEFEETSFPGQPKSYWTLDIREAKNRDGATFDLTEGLNTNASVIVNVDTSAFGPNLNNESGEDESNITQIEIEQ